MNTFYTIIRISTNSHAGDLISIGLLLCQDSKYFLKFSNEKKSAAKKLLNQNSDIVDSIDRQITQYINRANNNPKNKNELFPIENILTSDYFNKLNVYSNGILQFSKPSFLNDKIDTAKFDKLFSLMINKQVEIEQDYDQALIDKKNERFFSTVQRKLTNKVKTKIHTDIKIDSSYVPNLFFSFEMNCIGKNGSLIGAKAISFAKSEASLDRDITRYMAFIDLISAHYKKRGKNNFYLIADEPAPNTDEHKTYVQVQNNPLFTVVNSKEADIVVKEVEDSKAERFLLPVAV